MTDRDGEHTAEHHREDMDNVQQQATTSARQLGRNSAQNYDVYGRHRNSTSLRLRYIKKRSEESYKQLEILLQEMVGDQVERLYQENWGASKKYISQVLPCRDQQHHDRILRKVREGAGEYFGKLFLWVDEGDHFHIVHDCPYSNGSCRCRVFKDEIFRGAFRAPLRGTRNIGNFDKIDWFNVLIYFLLSKWKSPKEIWINGELQRLTSDSEGLRWEQMQRESREILDREGEGGRYYVRQERATSEDNRQLDGQSNDEAEEETGSQDGGYGKRKKKQLGRKISRFERVSETVESLLDQTMVIPAVQVKELFLDETMLHDPTNFKHYESACSLYTAKFNKFNLQEFKEFYLGKEPIFYANDVNPFTYYHTRSESFNFVNDLLKFQFNDSEEAISEFLTNIVSWFNKFGWERNPKCNALAIIGPPNSGKNYFFDMISSLAYNIGHIGRVNNKTNQFALQECVNRRLVVGNEISMEDGAIEDFKKLCEGTAFNIRVKFQGDKIFTKCPVLLISNFMLDICTHPHFRNIRLHTMRWIQADLLKHSNKKPYPLCLFDLFEHYNVFLH